MKLQDLIFWRWAKVAIEPNWLTLIPILFLFLCSLSRAQQHVQSATGRLIVDIISQDTVVSEVAAKSLAYRVKSGKSTKKDSVNYVNSIKNSKLSLFKYESNTLAKQYLQIELKRNGRAAQYLTNAVVKEILAKMPTDSIRDFPIWSDKIHILDTYNFGSQLHYFSAPIIIADSRYLLFHFNVKGLNNVAIEFHIYTIDAKGNYILEKEFWIPPGTL